MEYYNSQYLLHNLVRENNLLKSQINNLNNIIANNKNSTSENTSSGLSKDEVTQLIQTTDPKEHEHTSSDITDLDTTNFATKNHTHTSSQISDRIREYSRYTNPDDITSDLVMTAKATKGYVEEELENKADSAHNHITLDISDKIFEYTTNKLYFSVQPPFKVEGNELTIDSQYIQDESNWECRFDINYQSLYAAGVGTGDEYCRIGSNQTLYTSECIKVEYREGMPYISLLNELIVRVSLKVSNRSNTGLTDAVKDGCVSVISRGPTDMSSERLITANAVREYVESKNSNEKRIISVRTGYDTYYIILCKAEQGNFYTGCLNAGYYKNILINVFYSNEYLSGMGYIIGESLMYSNLTSYKAYLVQYEDVQYIALKVTWSGSEHNYTLGTSNCSDISIVKFVSEGVTEVEDLSSTISHHAFQD